MIFVTVGTHEQQFNRLVEYMDKLAGKLDEEIIIQTGFSTYIPKNCTWQKLFSYNEMDKNIKKARIVITHGGPSSFIAPLQIGKMPLVVPRKKEFGEHVNNHQIYFCKEFAKKTGNIYVVEDILVLQKLIKEYDILFSDIKNNNLKNNVNFCNNLKTIINKIMNI